MKWDPFAKFLVEWVRLAASALDESAMRFNVVQYHTVEFDLMNDNTHSSPETSGTSSAGWELLMAVRKDPVIEAYKKDIDRTLLRENLKLTPQERSVKFERGMALVYELRRQASARMKNAAG